MYFVFDIFYFLDKGVALGVYLFIAKIGEKHKLRNCQYNTKCSHCNWF